MFHIIYKISKGLILPCICIAIEMIILKRMQKEYRGIDLFCKWFVFWSLGVGGITAGLMQALNPSYTANLLSVVTNDMIIIKELGYANFGMGLIAVLSFKYQYFRKPAALASGMFIMGCTLNHFTRLGEINLGEIVSIIDDLWIIVIVIVTLAYKPKVKVI